MQFNRVGIQVKKVGLKLSTTGSGGKTVTVVVPDKEYTRLLALVDEGHTVFTAAFWASPDLHVIEG